MSGEQQPVDLSDVDLGSNFRDVSSFSDSFSVFRRTQEKKVPSVVTPTRPLSRLVFITVRRTDEDV